MRKTIKPTHTPKRKKKHVLSVLRKIIGASLNESRAVLGLAPDTVKSIQCGRLPFSEHAALIVAGKTGVSSKWLLDLDGRKPPKTESGDKFTKETFDRHEMMQGRYVYKRPENVTVNKNLDRYGCLKQFRTLTVKLAGLMLAAHASRNVAFIDAKLENEMRRLAKLLGQPERVREFESLVLNQTEDVDAESEAGLIAVFNQLKKELPPLEQWPWMKETTSQAPEQVKAARKRSRTLAPSSGE